MSARVRVTQKSSDHDGIYGSHFHRNNSSISEFRFHASGRFDCNNNNNIVADR